MKKLYLLRHSKSSWASPELRDFDRPLNDRGYREAKEMAQYIKEKGYRPDIILCSPARRTRETLKPIIEALEYEGPVLYLESIYESFWTNLKEAVDQRSEDSVMLIGHCPGIEMYLSYLLGKLYGMKTSQLAVLDMEEKKLLDFIRPKDF